MEWTSYWHRTVIFPDFQGMGIGVRLQDIVAQIHIEEGHKFYSRTSHPRSGAYRANSPLWKPTSKNKKLRTDINENNIYKDNHFDNKRVCFSHEYIGPISLVD
jgi:hypothetical protein